MALLERKPSQLSGGQQQRVALGRAIVAETRVCLMDEPLSNLDAQLRVEMRREIRALQRRLGMTMLYVTHDQVEAMTMADQVVLMRERPHRAGRGARRALREARHHLRGALRRHAADECRFRPRSFRSISRRPRTDARATRSRSASGPKPRELATDGLPATVAAVEYLGADTLLDTRDWRSALHRARCPAAPMPRPATRSAFAGTPAAAHWFDLVVTASHRSIREAPSGEQREEHHGPQTISTEHRGARGRGASPARRSRKATEVSFFYPIAVGGPITKIIDGYAADFEKANPSIKVKPIYSGTYQESITKALTAHKSGTPPVTSVLLSTDMFTLIDEDAIVPINDFLKTDDDKKWMASFFPAFMANSQTGGKIWGVPFQRSTIVLYWNKDLFKEAGLDPEKAPATWAEMQAFAEKLTKRDALRQHHAMGRADPLLRLPLLAVPGADHAGRRDPGERGRRPHLLRQARR